MKSKFQLSLDNIPTQSSFACLSLKFGSVLSALILILYSIFALAQCLAALNVLPTHWTPDDVEVVVSYGVVVGVTVAHTVTLFLSTIMLVGVLKWACSVYSIFALAQCLVAVNVLPTHWTPDDVEVVVSYGVVVGVTVAHTVTLFLSTIMLVGVLKEKGQLVKPWIIWTSLQVLVSMLIFVFWSTLSVVNRYGSNTLLVYVVEFLGLTVRFYMLMIVSSFFKHLEERSQEERERLRNVVNPDHWYNSA